MSSFKEKLTNEEETNDIIDVNEEKKDTENESKNMNNEEFNDEESDDEENDDEPDVGDDAELEDPEDDTEVGEDEADVDEADVDEDEADMDEDEADVDEDEADVDEDEETGIDDEDGDNKEDDEDNENKKASVKKIKYKSTKKPILTTNNYTYNVDNELFIDDQQFEKIDDSLKYNYSKIYHPECIHKNFDEMLKLTFIKRENNLIKDINHKTLPFLTKYEKTKAIGLRVKQLNSGSKPFINLQKVFNTNMVLDTNLIAERELMMKKIPFIISRPITNRISEYWNIKDLEIIC